VTWGNGVYRSAGRWRALALAVLALVFGASCASDAVAPGESGGAERGAGRPNLAVAYIGIPFGPFGLWTLSRVEYGPKPFTGSHNYVNADSLIAQLNAARSKGHRLIVAMAGGPPKNYITNGQFDLTKWKNVMNTYNKPALKTAVAAAVADGTIIGDMLVDEPETKQWGTTLNKAVIDEMAVYVKTIFPTIAVGVNHGPPAYKWKNTETYKKVDYAVYQYAHWVTAGNLTSWKDAVLAQAKRDGVTAAFSINVLNGGKQDRDGVYDCIGSEMGGFGTRPPNCNMTPTQIKTWGKALAPLGCAMLLWEFRAPVYSAAANLSAFTEIATLAASRPRKSCKRIV
jgi:hypothetical protein